MAIMFIRAQIISRGAGRSVVSAAAYRHRTSMIDQQAGTAFSYEAGSAELVHEELVLPSNTPQWLRATTDGRTTSAASEALWNAVEAFEKRADAQLARELIIALPEELTLAENIALVHEFVRDNLTSKGMVADWVYHDKGDNPHIHLMTTLRPLTAEGFGPKKVAVTGEDGEPARIVTPDRPGGRIVYRLWAGDKETMKAWKLAWAQTANRHLAFAGHDICLDGRSYAEQGLGGIAQKHLGPAKAALARKGREMYFAPADLARRREMADCLLENPGLLLKQLSNERSTFDERDMARALCRYVDDPTDFANIRARLMASGALITLKPQQVDPASGKAAEPALFTTRDMLRIEYDMARTALALSKRCGFAVAEWRVTAAIDKVSTGAAGKGFKLDPEQIDAIRHVTHDKGIAAVVGLAGAGKSTLLEAARIAWESEGRRVIGAALAGKAAEGLEDSSGITSRTLASWELAWANGRDRPERGDVLVIDEAGMVSSQQMERVLKIAEQAQAKVVLVGDAMQLQPIQAGAAFRAIVERTCFAELAGVRRQCEAWARDASRLFARGEVEKALAVYAQRGHITAAQSRDEAIGRIVAEWAEARKQLLEKATVAEDGPRLRGDELLVLAHTNDAVKRLNEALRAVMTEQGALAENRAFITERGKRDFAVGDRIIFLENARFVEPRADHLGPQYVKNGMLGTVVSTKDNRGHALLSVWLDSGRGLVFSEGTYRSIDHGYAATIHKSQGATVDRTFVLATSMMDRHLTYVAMTRHRDRADLYAASEDFESRPKWGGKEHVDHAAGVTGELVDIGVARFRQGEDVDPSPYADVKTEDGKTHRLWGVSLPKALAESGVATGDTVKLRKDGVERVTVKVPVSDEETRKGRYEERVVGRNTWTVKQVETAQARQERIERESHRPELFKALAERLSRTGAKTTTLDYQGEASYQLHINDFARRRGIGQLAEAAAGMKQRVAWRGRQLAKLWERASVALGFAIERERRMSHDDSIADLQCKVEREDRSRIVAAAAHDAAKENSTMLPILAAVTEFKTSVEDEARRRALMAPYYRQQRAALAKAATHIWRDPATAVKTIEDLIVKGISVNRVAIAVVNNPAAYGALRGSDRLIDRPLASGRERKQAQQAVPGATVCLRSVGSSYATAFAAESQSVRQERRSMTIEIPGLSKTAWDALARLTAEATTTSSRSLDGMVGKIDLKVREEFSAVSRALDARFGRNAIARDEKDIVNRVAPSQRQAFEAMRASLRVLQQSVRIDSSLKIMSERHLRAISRAPGLDI